MPAHTSILLLACFVLVSTVLSSQEQNYGLGRSVGRVNCVNAESENSHAGYYNPALVGAQTSALFSFSTAAARVHFENIGNVVVDHPRYRTANSRYTRENYQPKNSSHTFWSVGFTYPFSLPKYVHRKAGIGISLSGPYGKFRSYRAGTPYDFYSLRYGSADDQVNLATGFSVELIPEQFYIGAGVALFTSSSGAADTSLTADNPAGRIAFDVGLNAALVSGFFWKMKRSRLGFVYRQEVNPTFEMHMEDKIQIAQGQESVVIPLSMRSSLYYEPHSLEWDFQQHFDAFTISVGLVWQLWSKYDPSFVVLETKNASNESLGTQIEQNQLRNTLYPRASLVVPITQNFNTLVGYSYRPSPVEDLGGPHNILDSSSHIFGGGFNYEIATSTFFPIPINIGIYWQYQTMDSRTITKRDPQSIGAPGYTIQGTAYLYGLTLQAAL